MDQHKAKKASGNTAHDDDQAQRTAEVARGDTDGASFGPQHEYLLRAQLARSESENRQLKARLGLYEGTAAKLSTFGNYLMAGPGLTRALERWEAAFSGANGSLGQRIPRQESVEVVAAYLRRRALSGVFIAAVAVIPSALTLILLWQQNTKIDQQIFLTAAYQSQENRAELSAALAAIEESATKACLPSLIPGSPPYSDRPANTQRQRDQLSKQASLEVFHCWSRQQATNPVSRREWLSRNDERYVFPPVKDTTVQLLSHKEGHGFRVRGYPADYLIAMSLPGSDVLQRKLMATSYLMRPYRLLLDQGGGETKPALSKQLYSPERGAILKAMGVAKMSPENFDASQAWAPGAQLAELRWEEVDLTGAMMECADFSAGRFVNVDFSKGVYESARFDFADFSRTNSWSEANIKNASFAGAILPLAEVFDPATVAGVDFHEALVPEIDWHARLPGMLAQRLSNAGYTYRKLDSSEQPIGHRGLSVAPGQTYWVMLRPANQKSDGVQNRQTHCAARKSAGYREM